MVHLIPIHMQYSVFDLLWIYLREVVRLHGLPSSIVSDRDTWFTSCWWQELHRILGAKLLMSTLFHPQMDGQTERGNRSIGQILRTVVNHNQSNWVDKIDMIEFVINSSISATTGYSPFELNYSYMPSMIQEIQWEEAVAKGIKMFAATALQNLAEAHNTIIESRVFQTHSANKSRREEPKISAGDLVYLLTKNLNLPKGRAHKLCPKFIGPFKIARTQPETSNYTLELPAALQMRGIIPTFHVSLIQPYHASNDALFPNRLYLDPYDFGAPKDQEWFVDNIIAHRWNRPKELEYQVRWSLGDTTWEPHANCSKLAALDQYFSVPHVFRSEPLGTAQIPSRQPISERNVRGELISNFHSESDRF